MPWSIIRKATEEDIERLENSAKKFATRHDLGEPIEDDTFVQLVGYETEFASQDGASDIERNWIRCVRRALGESEAEGISRGYIGFHVD